MTRSKALPREAGAPLTKKQAAFAASIAARAGGRPLGSTLTALLALAPCCDDLIVDANEVDECRDRLQAQHGIIAIGRISNGYFGAVASKLGKTIDESPIAYADRQGMTPETATENLASFLGVVAFQPDFFNVHGRTLEDWQSSHEEFFASIDATDKRLFARVAKLPGVPRVERAQDVHALLAAAPAHVFVAAASPPRTDPPMRSDVISEVRRISCEQLGTKVLMLIDLREIEIADEHELTLSFHVRAPAALMQRILDYYTVDGALGAFVAEVDVAYPDRQLRLKFEPEPVDATSDPMVRLAFALRVCKELELLAELGLA